MHIHMDIYKNANSGGHRSCWSIWKFRKMHMRKGTLKTVRLVLYSFIYIHIYLYINTYTRTYICRCMFKRAHYRRCIKDGAISSVFMYIYIHIYVYEYIYMCILRAEDALSKDHNKRGEFSSHSGKYTQFWYCCQSSHCCVAYGKIPRCTFRRARSGNE